MILKKTIFLLLLGVLIFTLSFAAQSNGKGKAMDITTQNQAVLTATIQPAGDTLQLSYKFENHTGTSVYLLNKLMDIDVMGNTSLNSQRLYIFPEDDDTLVLAKMLLKVPANLMVEAPEIPGVTKVESGHSFSETISLALPLRIDYPYPGKPFLEKTKIFKTLKFKLGILPNFQDLRLHPSQCGEQEVLMPEYGQALQAQKLSISQEFKVPVEVRFP
jgi:hypothetical protein